MPRSLAQASHGIAFRRFVFTSYGVVVAIVEGVVRGLTTLVKIKNRSRKRSHKLNGIGIGRFWRRFPFFRFCLRLRRSWRWKVDCWIRNRNRNIPNLPILLTTRASPSLMIQWKLDCRSRKQKWKNKPITRPGIKYCDWLILPHLLATPTMQFSLDRKRRSHKRNRCSTTDSVGLIFNRSLRSTLLVTAPTTTLMKTSLY